LAEHRIVWLPPDHEDNPKPDRWHNTEQKMYGEKSGLLVVRHFLSTFVPGAREPFSFYVDLELSEEEFEAAQALQGQPVHLENFRVSVRGKSGVAIFSADAVTPVGDAK